MEYFQGDTDAMRIELGMWQSAHAVAREDIRKGEMQTDHMLEQYKFNLAKLEDNIKETNEQINSTTANILQNNERIAKLVTSQ